jgi:hypothetical protein
VIVTEWLGERWSCGVTFGRVLPAGRKPDCSKTFAKRYGLQRLCDRWGRATLRCAFTTSALFVSRPMSAFLAPPRFEPVWGLMTWRRRAPICAGRTAADLPLITSVALRYWNLHQLPGQPVLRPTHNRGLRPYAGVALAGCRCRLCLRPGWNLARTTAEARHSGLGLGTTRRCPSARFLPVSTSLHVVRPWRSALQPRNLW